MWPPMVSRSSRNPTLRASLQMGQASTIPSQHTSYGRLALRKPEARPTFLLSGYQMAT